MSAISGEGTKPLVFAVMEHLQASRALEIPSPSSMTSPPAPLPPAGEGSEGDDE
jgi:hypothetical protein